jgi:hypothetical protein
MAGHSRLKNGVASLAYVQAISILVTLRPHNRDARHKAGHDDTLAARPACSRY